MVAFIGRHQTPDGHEIAYDSLAATARPGTPGVIFLHGLASDRKGNKAAALADYCAERGYGFLRFDMYGHGDSTGRFEDAGPSRWCADAVAILDAVTSGPQVLVGSSMGGWIMLLVALARPARVAALIGLAPAPDFTEDLMWREMTDTQRAELGAKGVIEVPGDYGNPPLRISRHLIDDGRAHCLLGAPIDLRCPVRLLHGQQDTSVPWQRSLQIAERLTGTYVKVTLIKDGDHRLSRPQDLDLLGRTLDQTLADLRV
jgi:pimeloyl-ACP methyl ester carboxylesterase